MTNNEKASEMINGLKFPMSSYNACKYDGTIEIAEWKDKNAWRSTSEELPELEKRVICLYECEDKSFYVCFNYRTVDDKVETVKNEWVNLYEMFDGKEPSYWQYKPLRKMEKTTIIHEDRIKELNDMLEACKEKRNTLSNEIVEIKKKIASTIEEEEPIRRELEGLIVEQWIDRGKNGLNKSLKYDELPVVVKRIYGDILSKITGGCNGDWYDGCRGCENKCHAKADEEWRKMFGFDQDINHR